MSSKLKKRILIVDDDATIQEALTLLLTEEGYDVHNLASAHNVPSWLDHNTPDMIITDYLMPGKNGAELTKIIRGRSDTKDIPILMMAATRHYDRYGYAAGVDKFIVKPFEIDYMLRQVKYFLGE